MDDVEVIDDAGNTPSDVPESAPEDPSKRRFLIGIAAYVATSALTALGCTRRDGLCDCDGLDFKRLAFPSSSLISSRFNLYCLESPRFQKFLDDFSKFQELPYEEKKEIFDETRRGYESFRAGVIDLYNGLKQDLATRPAEEWFNQPEIMEFVYAICELMQDVNRIGLAIYFSDRELHEKTGPRGMYRGGYISLEIESEAILETARETPWVDPYEIAHLYRSPLPYEILPANSMNMFNVLPEISPIVTSSTHLDRIVSSWPLVLVEFAPSENDAGADVAMNSFENFEKRNASGFRAFNPTVRPKTVKYFPANMGMAPIFDNATFEKLDLFTRGNGFNEATTYHLTYALFMDGKFVSVSHEPFLSGEDIARWVEESLKKYSSGKF